MSDENSTDLFLSLTPDKVLHAVDSAGLKTNPVCYPLNSFENRVYEVELEDKSRVVAKFYRPGRWTEAQIMEEHAFMTDLEAAEIPLCGLRPFPDGNTLKRIDHIYYCLYPRKGGRAPDELTPALAQRLGMLLGRIHTVGASRSAEHRVRLNVDSYVHQNLDYLEAKEVIPSVTLKDRYFQVAMDLADIADERFKDISVQRIHGDFHLGNLLFRDERVHALDFDDMVVGPPVQDLWLALPGPVEGPDADPYDIRLLNAMLEGYEQFLPFDRATLGLIEPLRAMRLIHYAVWLARRWHDPVFPRTWPHFGGESYWQNEAESLEDILARIRGQQTSEAAAKGEAAAAQSDEPELTNKDFFWDWEE